jgi:hypothetical protein
MVMRCVGTISLYPLQPTFATVGRITSPWGGASPEKRSHKRVGRGTTGFGGAGKFMRLWGRADMKSSLLLLIPGAAILLAVCYFWPKSLGGEAFG